MKENGGLPRLIASFDQSNGSQRSRIPNEIGPPSRKKLDLGFEVLTDIGMLIRSLTAAI
jgi:hypothetical protein